MGTTSPEYSTAAAQRPAQPHWRPWREVWRRANCRDGRQPAGPDGGNGRNGSSILRSTGTATTSWRGPDDAANGPWTAPRSLTKGIEYVSRKSAIASPCADCLSPRIAHRWRVAIHRGSSDCLGPRGTGPSG